MPHADCSRVSRMREIRTSGLMRGEAAASLPLSYSTFSSLLVAAEGRAVSSVASFLIPVIIGARRRFRTMPVVRRGSRPARGCRGMMKA